MNSPHPDLLKRIRVYVLELSQAELAAELGVDVGTVSRWERGTQQAPRYVELALCELERRQVKKLV